MTSFVKNANYTHPVRKAEFGTEVYLCRGYKLGVQQLLSSLLAMELSDATLERHGVKKESRSTSAVGRWHYIYSATIGTMHEIV